MPRIHEKNDNAERVVLRYHGGKARIASRIVDLFPPHQIYVEPFGGGASVLINKPVVPGVTEIYNDIDGEVVNLFRVLRDQPDALLEALNLTPYARDEFWQANEPAKDKVERARRLCTRVMQGFGARLLRPYGGGFRRETRGDNYAGDWCAYVEQLEAIAARLRRVSIENIDALKLIERMDGEETLHYLDPPYLLDAGDGTYAFDLDYAGHEQLLDAIQHLKGYVLLSGYPTALYQEKLANRWYLKQWRNHTDKHAVRTECLWLNERAARYWLDDIGAKIREQDKVPAPPPPPRRKVARVVLAR